MTSIRTGRHCVFELHVLLVFVAKYRKKIFTQEHIDALRVIAAKVCEDFGAELRELNGENLNSPVPVRRNGESTLGRAISAPILAML